jgi:hypothetical protein
MEASLLLGDSAIIVADPKNRCFQTVSHDAAAQLCQRYPFLRLFSDQKTISFSLKELPAVPPWFHKKMVQLNLKPKIPSHWFASPLSFPFPLVFKKVVSLVPFQVVEQPLCFPQRIPDIPGAYFSGIEPLSLAIPNFWTCLMSRALLRTEWWVYCANHQLSGTRLVFGRGKGIVLSRTLTATDPDVLSKELAHTLKYMERLGWQREPITGLLIETSGPSFLHRLIKEHKSFQATAISLEEVAHKTGVSYREDISVEEILFRWALRKRRHFPCLGSPSLRWKAVGMRVLNALRPLCYSLGSVCCVGAFCSLIRIGMLIQQERTTEGIMRTTTIRTNQLEILSKDHLCHCGVSADVLTTPDTMTILHRCAQHLQQARANIILPKLEAIAVLFQDHTPDTLTLQMTSERAVSFEMSIPPEEQEAFLSFVTRVFPDAEVTLPQEEACKPLLSHATPSHIRLKITFRLPAEACVKGAS